MEISACVGDKHGGPGSGVAFESATIADTGETDWIGAAERRTKTEKSCKKWNKPRFVKHSHHESSFS